jgi:hypothetical protein
VREWVEWVKHNLHSYTAPLPPSLSSEVQNPQNFPFIFFKNPVRPQKRKRVENFSVFEAPTFIGARKQAHTKVQRFFWKKVRAWL